MSATEKFFNIMTPNEAMHYLCSLPFPVFACWFNEFVVDPYEDLRYGIIRKNEPDEFWKAIKESDLSPEAFIAMPKSYAETDSYFILAESLQSFNRAEELMKCAHGQAMVEIFVNAYEENPDLIADLEDERKAYYTGKFNSKF